LQLTEAPTGLGAISSPMAEGRRAIAIGEPAGPSQSDERPVADAGTSDEDALQARLDALRRG